MTRFSPLPFDPGLGGARTGSRIEHWALFAVAPMVDLTDEAAIRAAADALVDAELPESPAPPAGARHWYDVPRVEARRLLLRPLRFSLAYNVRALDAPAFAAADAFLAAFGPDARILSPIEGLGALLDDEGCRPRGGYAYASSFLLTTATFEVGLVIVDWERAGLFVATDED